MEILVEMSIEIHKRLVGCAHYPQCLMQALTDSLRAEDFSCAPCALYQQEITKGREQG